MLKSSPRSPEPLHEWEKNRFIPDAQLTAADQELRDQLAEGEDQARLVVEEVKGGLRVSASSWIGVVRFEELELRIVPKLVGGNLGVLRMINYASGLGSLKRLPRNFNLSVGEPNLVDLVCLLLAHEAESVLAAGLLQGYVTREDALPVLRGRLLTLQQARERFLMLDKLECQFDEFETDIVENRLIAAGLERAGRVCLDESIRRRVRSMRSVLAEACDASGLGWDAIEAIEYDRRNDNYRSAHLWSKLLLQRTALKDVFEGGEGRSFSFLLNMNQLFEDFVSRLVSDGFAVDDHVMVSAQHRDDSIIQNERTMRPYSAVIPDLLVEVVDVAGKRRIPLDAKYKLYDSKKIAPGDVYQTFMYSYAFGSDSHIPVAILIYPGAADSEGTALRIRVGASTRASRIAALSLNVPQLLAQIASGDLRTGPLALRQRLVDAWQVPEAVSAG